MKRDLRLPLAHCLLLFSAVVAPVFGQDNKEIEHWAFQPLAEIEVPSSDVGPVDAFIHAKLADAGLKSSADADRRTVIRRLHLDMHGLPPTPEEVKEFANSGDPDAWNNLIDEVLRSPRYGERWAQHWLDLVRYADTHGFEVNTERPNAWPYRDYVIRAFNEDKPYNKFVFEQLAGDSAGEDAATGFLVASAVLLPGQIGKDEESKRLARQDELDEMIVGTSDTFLALSVGCARCHDHKFDPIPQRDYYAMQAFFAGVEFGDRPLRNPEAARMLAEIDADIAKIRNRMDAIEPIASRSRIIVIDDEDSSRTTSLKTKNGHGTNPAGKGRGYRDDPGGPDRVPNLSGSKYAWWDNTAGEDTFTYNPGTEGKFRVWLSWGVHGSGVHTRDARYVLDIDGNLSTRDDQNEIAKADQYYFVNVSEGETEKKPLWSGLLDAGVHTLEKSSRIILRGGDTGTGITADVILLQETSDADTPVRHPALRGPVDPQRNVERFTPVKSKFVRFTIFATNENNKHEPCIDELEVINTAGRNVARDGTATSSGNRSGDPQHQLKHINDGRYGNSQSWISNEIGKGWVQIEFPESATIERIIWGRDRDGKFRDRLAIDYKIEVALNPGEWKTVASSQDRAARGTPYDTIAALQRNLPDDSPDSLKTDAAKLAKLESRRAELQTSQTVYAGKFRSPDKTHVLYRGDPEQKREAIGPAVPRTLGPLILGEDVAEQDRRMTLARWIANPANPLTARVMVNRIWQYHFGRGLVETASDFGLTGAKPSHSELLDWLAREFIKSGWSIKYLHRLILRSETYRQSNQIDLLAQERDADCRLLWRFPSRRLEAEAIRDGMLAVSGKLNLKMGGPGFDFFSSRGGLNGFPPIEKFPESSLRRMIYAHKVRMERVPVFGAFDCPDAGQATPNRSRSTTAIQALNLFNSKFVIGQANAFASRIQSELGKDAGLAPMVERAFELALGRKPSITEAKASESTVRKHGLAVLCRVLFNSNEFLFLP